MSENLEVNQTAAFGSHGNTIIGTVNTGLSVTDAMQMALQIFREYYPQLKKEAIDELQKMLLRFQHCKAQAFLMKKSFGDSMQNCLRVR